MIYEQNFRTNITKLNVNNLQNFTWVLFELWEFYRNSPFLITWFSQMKINNTFCNNRLISYIDRYTVQKKYRYMSLYINTSACWPPHGIVLPFLVKLDFGMQLWIYITKIPVLCGLWTSRMDQNLEVVFDTWPRWPTILVHELTLASFMLTRTWEVWYYLHEPRFTPLGVIITKHHTTQQKIQTTIKHAMSNVTTAVFIEIHLVADVSYRQNMGWYISHNWISLVHFSFQRC